MSQPSNDPEKQKRLNAILGEYGKRRDAGQPVSAAALLQAYPDLADGLRSHFQKEAARGNLASAQTIPPKQPPKRAPANVRETMNPGAVPSDTASDFRNRTFGRYQLLRPLGEGAMGSVYLALDTTLDRQVALKMPKSDGSAGEDFMARFTREAKAAAGLKHPGICSVYDAGQHDGIPYITMDYIDGAPLTQFIGSSQLQSVDSILQMISIIAEAVGHAHSNGVVHRDLKPGNIIVDSQFRPHVTDFGLARRIGPTNESRMTQEGLLIGTPAYMAPEQVKGEQSKVGPRSDIYSLGVILFELLTSRLPFEGSVPEMLAKVLRDVPPVPSRLRKDLSEDVDDLCLKMLRKDPEKRFASMDEVVAAIAQVRKSLGKAPSRPDGTDRQRSPFEIQKAHIEEMLKRGQYAAAIQDLEKLAQEKQVGAKAVAEWARTRLPGVRAEAKAMNPAGLSALLNTAQQLFEKHDYPGCIQLLEDVPSLRRTEAMEELLEKAQSKELEAEQLLSDIKDRERRENLDGIEPLVKRLLKLKPGNVYAKRLWDALHTYSRLPGSQRRYRFVKGRLQAKPQLAFLREWGVLTGLFLVVGILVCLSIYSYSANYLNTDDQTLERYSDSQLSENDRGEPAHTVDEQLPVSDNTGQFRPATSDEAITSLPRSHVPSATRNLASPPICELPLSPNESRSQQAVWAEYLGLPVEVTSDAGPKFVLIPPGRFEMGPEYNVTISQPFYLGEFEITRSNFDRFIRASGHTTDAERFGGVLNIPKHSMKRGDFTWRSPGIVQDDAHPVVQVSWNDANAYCRWLSEQDGYIYRLPTEAEWEWACRAGTSSAYYFGDDAVRLPEFAWYLDNTQAASTQPVGQLTANSWGLFDMYGNAFEWVRDFRGPYPTGDYTDPTGPISDSEDMHSVRGGTIDSPAEECVSDLHRPSGVWYGGVSSLAVHSFGFRVLREIPQRQAQSPTVDGVPEWTDLFNGKDLTGWTELRMSSGKAEAASNIWQIRNRDLSSRVAGGWLRENALHSDFSLEFDVRVTGAARGLMTIRTKPNETYTESGIRILIHNDHEESDPIQRSGATPPHAGPIASYMKSPGEWNHFQVVCEGNLLRVNLNGTTSAVVGELNRPGDQWPTSGHITLLCETPADQGMLEYRNMRIKELSQPPAAGPQDSLPANALSEKPTATVTGGLAVFVAGKDGTLKQYDMDGKELASLTLPAPAYDLECLDDGVLAVIPEGGKLLLIRDTFAIETLAAHLEPQTELHYAQPIGIAFDRKTSSVFVGDNSRDELSSFPIADPAKRQTLKRIGKPDRSEDFNIEVLDNGVLIVSNSGLGLIMIPNLGTGDQKTVSNSEALAIAAQPGTTRWACCSYEYAQRNRPVIHVFDNEKRVVDIPLQKNPQTGDPWWIFRMFFSRTGRLFVLLGPLDPTKLECTEIHEIDMATRAFIPRFSVAPARDVAIGQQRPWPTGR